MSKKLFTDGQTDGQPKTIVRNLTKIIKILKERFGKLKKESTC